MPLTIDGQANSITSSVGGVNIPATVGTLSVGPSGSYMNVTSSGIAATSINATNITTTQILNSSGRPILNSTGSILQVVQTVKSDIFSNATKGSYVAVTGLSATITPTSTTSKILVMSEVTWDSQNNYPVLLHIYRGGAQITPNGNATGYTPSSAYNSFQQPADSRAWLDQQTLIYLDSPASTSALTYQIYAAKPSVAASNIIINSFGSSNITLMEVSA
jgi:hypothetical protein